MDAKQEKSEKIVKSIKLLESVLRTTRDDAQKSRVKKNIAGLNRQLKELHPNTNIKELVDAIFSNIMAIPDTDNSKSLKKYDLLRNIEIEPISPHKEDWETNEAAGIMKHFEDKYWTIISDQYIQLDFSNSSDRDGLYRQLDGCNRALKTFQQTIEDIEKTKSPEYSGQLHLMRVRHSRLLLYDIYQFFKNLNFYISNIIANYEAGGNMIMNPTDKIIYEKYEDFHTFEGYTVIDALFQMEKYIKEVLDLLNVPEMKL